MKQRIGWIGTGVMGEPMCAHVMEGGYSVSVFNRTEDKSRSLVEKGAKWRKNGREVGEGSDIVFTIVGIPADVEEVILGDHGVLKGMKPGSCVVDMTTSEPSLAQRISREAQKVGCHALDAPVSGGDIGARDGTLSIMVGGDRDVFEDTMPLFRLFGKTISYMGESGAGQHTKVSNQILGSANIIGTVESLLYAYKAGLDLEEVVRVVGQGACGSWIYNNLGPRIIHGDFHPGFFIKHFVKDMGIALSEARRMNLSLPGLAMVQQFYLSAMALGWENLGTQALYKVFEKMNGMNG